MGEKDCPANSKCAAYEDKQWFNLQYWKYTSSRMQMCFYMKKNPLLFLIFA